MFTLLANAVEVTGPGGEHVTVNPIGPMLISAFYFFLLMLPIIIILFFFYYKKKLQHQQIMLAIEKGHPVADLLAAPTKKEKGWVTNISAGIGLIFVAIALLFLYVPAGVYIAHNLPRNSLVVIPIVLIGLGLTRLIRGLFQKKAEALAQQNGKDKTLVNTPPAES